MSTLDEIRDRDARLPELTDYVCGDLDAYRDRRALLRLLDETARDRDAMIARALHEYADRLAAVPMACTALTGPVWYGQGWRDATHHLHDLADGLMPAPQRPGAEAAP